MRQYLPLLLIAALWVPLLATIWPPRDVPLAENRRLAPALALPNSWSELRASPAAIDEWTKDHFGFRKQLLVAHSRLRFWLFGEYPSDTLLAGKGGEIFFRFGKSGNTVLLELCGVGLSQATINARTAKIADFLSRIRRLDAKTHVLAVPEKSRVYPDKLPDWMQRECALGVPPLPTILTDLATTPGHGKAVLYPLAAMQGMTPRTYPAANFHWSTAGAQPVAELMAETQFGLKPSVTLPYLPNPSFSDLSSFMPGLWIPILDGTPDFAAADVLACQNQASCFPEFPEAAGSLDHVSRFRRDYLLPHEQRHPRLLIISDSFGTAIAPGFAPYFAEVWHFSVNSLDQRLTPAQQEQVRHISIDLFHPDIVLFVFSEATLMFAADNLQVASRFVTGK